MIFSFYLKLFYFQNNIFIEVKQSTKQNYMQTCILTYTCIHTHTHPTHTLTNTYMYIKKQQINHKFIKSK